ncbi:response regulator transcription factor [Nocardioides nitrophenolicus]|uniref:response regulator transcription factor n=1 Tax=Nocardioides nitrophenolicus TaxID=60489 RepID=UPI00195C8673|nr:LuxR C-terminal-related transcriptional regulator [Nocardioides nitrophenolicus]MBM7518205.1 DNA-binding NarL/FixJ family response regulator [Nocardioides nitrophenolicus]
MDDDAAASRVLAVMDGLAADRLVESGPPDRSPGASAVAAYGLLFAARFDEALARVAMSEGHSPYQRAVRRQVEALCSATISDSLDTHGADPATLGGAMAVFHTCEAAHVVGALRECERLASEALQLGVRDRRVRTWLRLALVRGLLFQGEIARATDELDLAAADATTPVAEQAVRCLRALVAGLRGDTEAVVSVAEQMRALIVAPATYADSGLALVGAFGLASCGYPAAAAELLRYGSGGAGLPLLPPALRAYGYDLLVEAAIAGGNLELAEWILADFDRLALGDNAQMIAAREAAHARHRVACGEVEAGLRRASAAAGRAAGVSSHLIGVRAVLAAAQAGTNGVGAIAEADVARLMVDVAGDDLRDWLVRALARSGRRPRPLPGVGWDRLTPTQTVVARLAARGLRNQEIAELLVVSPRTVEVHVAAVLDVLGVTSRVGIVGAARPAAVLDQTVLDRLTPRQRQVAAALTAGRSNAEIALELSLGVKTVEKHVSAVLRSLRVSSRAAAAARLLGVDE